jgi:hypothetical protein
MNGSKFRIQKTLMMNNETFQEKLQRDTRFLDKRDQVVVKGEPECRLIQNIPPTADCNVHVNGFIDQKEQILGTNVLV